MPAGRFPIEQRRAAALRLFDHLEQAQQAHDRDETRLQLALTFIKHHITEERTPQNEDLHNAVLLIVEFARKHNHLVR